jgi:putative transposase
VKKVLGWLDLPSSVFYYRHRDGKPGIKPSTYTQWGDVMVKNELVVEIIKEVLNQEFVRFGYKTVTKGLQQLGMTINKKKVYRIMQENHLLLGTGIRVKGRRNFIRFRVVFPTRPMEYLCMDIKYVYIPEERRHQYLLTILDIYSRRVLDWILQPSNRKYQVVALLRRIDQRYPLKGVILRNDNGSQFLALVVRELLEHLGAFQEFTHVATPEDNSYIEALHSLLEKELFQRYEYSNQYQAKLLVANYYTFYNTMRPHSGIGYRSPNYMWNEYFSRHPNDKHLLTEAENISSMASRGQVVGEATLPVLDIFEASAKFVLSSMKEKTVKTDLTVFKNLSN